VNRILLPSVVLFALPFTALAGTPKVDVCHVSGHSYAPIDVSSSAVAGHVGHGDWVVTDEACDDGVDNDCDGQVDEDCPVCPCYTLDDLRSWFDAGDQCYDYDYSQPGAPLEATYLASYEGAGLAAGVGDYYFYPAPFCAVIDLTNTGLVDFGISDEEYVDCSMLVEQAAAELSISCGETSPE
jgi:hypothetical protein